MSRVKRYDIGAVPVAALSALLSLTAALASPAIGCEEASPAQGVVVSGTPVVGQTLTLASTFQNDHGDGTQVLDTEVYDSHGQKVAQWFEQVYLANGSSVTHEYPWDTTGLAPGVYRIHQGVFTEHWGSLIEWRDDAGSVELAATGTGGGGGDDDEQPTPPPGPDDPLNGVTFYGPNLGAAMQADAWQSTRPADAALMRDMAQTPTAAWFGDWSGDVRAAVDAHVTAAAHQGAVPILVAYNIPGRDCGQHSSGGAGSEGEYNTWIEQFAAGIGSRKAVVVIEPDTLGQLCGDVSARYRMLNHAVDALAAQPGAVVYLDAANPGWVDPGDMASRLQAAGVARARGFSINVSNFKDTPSNIAYGDDIANRLGGSHYIIDTSRNGNGSNGEWCNPAGRALGQKPTSTTGSAAADAYLWIKIPGESDGECNGGPAAGQWWGDYALGLAQRA